MLKYIGILCVVLGVIGIFLPLLPTTPFLLLALFFFARSSEKYKARLLSDRHLKPYLEPYINGNVKMPQHAKVKTLVLMWAMMVVSMFLIENLYVSLLLVVIACAVSVHILMIGRAKKTARKIFRNNNKTYLKK